MIHSNEVIDSKEASSTVVIVLSRRIGGEGGGGLMTMFKVSSLSLSLNVHLGGHVETVKPGHNY